MMHYQCCAGVLAATEHRWDDAEKQFRIVLEQEPDSASAWSNLGNVHLSKGRPHEAYRDFTEAIRLAPTVCCLLHCSVSAEMDSNHGTQFHFLRDVNAHSFPVC